MGTRVDPRIKSGDAHDGVSPSRRALPLPPPPLINPQPKPRRLPPPIPLRQPRPQQRLLAGLRAMRLAQHAQRFGRVEPKPEIGFAGMAPGEGHGRIVRQNSYFG